MRRFLTATPKTAICLQGPQHSKMVSMEVQPITIAAFMQWLQNQTDQVRPDVIIETRFVVNSREAGLLDARQERPLATIRF